MNRNDSNNKSASYTPARWAFRLPRRQKIVAMKCSGRPRGDGADRSKGRRTWPDRHRFAGPALSKCVRTSFASAHRQRPKRWPSRCWLKASPFSTSMPTPSPRSGRSASTRWYDESRGHVCGRRHHWRPGVEAQSTWLHLSGAKAGEAAHILCIRATGDQHRRRGNRAGFGAQDVLCRLHKRELSRLPCSAPSWQLLTNSA